MPIRPTSVSKPLKIYEIRLDRAKLDRMPEDARRTLFLFGHVANEINTLNRLLIFSIKEQDDRIMGIFAEARGTSLARILIGTTCEGYRALQRFVLGQKFGQTYLPHLSGIGKQALEKVKRNLGNMKLLAAIRNDFAFHLPHPDQIADAYSGLPVDLELSILSGKPRHSSLYAMSSLLMTRGLLDLAKTDDDLSDEQLMHKIVDDALTKSGDLNDFIEHLLGTIVEQEALSPEDPNVILTVDGHQSMKTFTIPPLLRS